MVTTGKDERHMRPAETTNKGGKAKINNIYDNRYLIFTYLCIRMKPSHRTNLLLACCILLLTILCWMSISQPLRFDKERSRRETAVKQRLLQIREAETAYLKTHRKYTDSFDTLVAGGFLADSVQYIPYGGGKRFTLATTVAAGKSDAGIPLMECGAAYSDYLDGLDPAKIADITRKANDNGMYAGLKIGDLTTANDNAGNWE